MSPSPLRHPARMAGASLLRLQSDERLADLAAHGHEAAFDAIVDRYRTPLTRYCAGIVGPSRAEDVVQQALINAHNALQRTDEVRHLRSWLYRITHNAALNVLRAVRDDVPLDEATGAAAIAEDGPAATFERSERFRATVEAVRELPERQRAALVLRELEGRSHEEIAETLGVTSGAARQHLMRARVALRGAVTAITPYPLIVRLAEMIASPGTAGWTDVAVGAGTGATLAKLTAGVAATGALVGGAVGTERVVHHRGSAQDAAAATQSSGKSAAKRAATTRAVSLPAAGSVLSTGPSTSGPGGPGSAGSETERRERTSRDERRSKGNDRDDDHRRDHDSPSDRSSGGVGRDHDGSSGPGAGGPGRNRGNDGARGGGRSGAASGKGHRPDGSTSKDSERGKRPNAGREGEGRHSKSSGKGKGERGGPSGGGHDSDSSTSGPSHAGSADSSGSAPGRQADSDHSVSSATPAAPVTEPSATVTTPTPPTNSGSESVDSASGGSGRSGSDDAASSDRSGVSGSN